MSSIVKPALTLHLPGGVPMTFQRVPTVGDPQPFRMGERNLRGYEGSSDPVVQVQLSQPFYLGTYPVTQAQFGVWTAAEGIQHANDFKDHPDHPAENMDWREANGFCAWLTRVAGGELPEGWMACLPTETEWEYACRAGTETEYYTGDGEVALAEVGWYTENSEKSTRPVGLKRPNGFGLYDLHGNVLEWCHDAWEPEAYREGLDGDEDPWVARRLEDWGARLEQMKAWTQSRVLRGGSWLGVARDCRSASRYGLNPDFRHRDFGFRVCLVPGPCSGGRGAPGEEAPGDGGRGTRPESDGAWGGVSGGVPDLTTAKMPRAAVENFFEK